MLLKIFYNRILWVSILSGIIAQFIKFFIYWVKYRRPDFSWLFSTGGMPSSHTASVMTLSTLCGFYKGFDSVLFGVTLYFSLIIMYDAAGLRRAAGLQAKVLNKILKEIGQKKNIFPMRLKEFLGHTRLEVFVGALLGIAIGVLFR